MNQNQHKIQFSLNRTPKMFQNILAGNTIRCTVAKSIPLVLQQPMTTEVSVSSVPSCTVETTYTRINLDDIPEIPTSYPTEFMQFCETNSLHPPKISTGNGKALAAMLAHPGKYWDRATCDSFVAKFAIPTKDSIQLFNKHSQWGLRTNSGLERGKLYIIYPYALSNKHKMRKDFKFDGTAEEKALEITRIKSTIIADYIDVPADKWQLGHKNPGSTDNSTCNLILQPPIQGKYRDDYLFFDTLTKMPLPAKLRKMLDVGEVELTKEQIADYLALFTALTKQTDKTDQV